ncbi:MAG: bifunctional adenosylcobinamide kinase/adenosylcobinamide-phosphate guanylyltransferase [Methyloligellaceae bacterium]
MAAAAHLTLVLGGARSGKSRYAESLAANHAGPRRYIATARADDDEMAARIETHRARRGEDWETIEAPADLPGAVARAGVAGSFVLVDCLTLWLSNLILADKDIGAETQRLIAALEGAAGRTVLVSNEVGLGIVPQTRLGRLFRDEAGLLNQRIAQIADEVILIAAGLPLTLKPPG